jgi:hypothetical protein
MKPQARIVLDNAQALAELDELTALSKLGAGFDLFEFLRLLTQAGLSPFVLEVDRSAAVATGDVVQRHHLSEPMKGLLAALRALHGYADKVERAARHPVPPISPSAILAQLPSEGIGGRSEPAGDNLVG